MDDPVTLDEVMEFLPGLIEDAVSHVEETYADNWEAAQDYYNGETDLPTIEGRSQVVDTVVRDTIRGLRPSLLRIFMHTTAVAEYLPSGTDPDIAQVAWDQSLYVNQLFYQNAGYLSLYEIFQTASLQKYAIAEAYWDDTPLPVYYSVKGVTLDAIAQYESVEGVEITEVSEREASEATEAANSIPLYDASLVYKKPRGTIVVQHVPNHSFFFDADATDVGDTTLCGTRINTPIGDIIAMGLDYEDLKDLDGLDVEIDSDAGTSEKKRGFQKDQDDKGKASKDPMLRKVLLTECYIRLDLDGIGIPQLYRFLLGGTNYEYLHHEKVDSHPYVKFCIDPEPGAWAGKSIYDICKQDQDTQTSLLRATCDNAHLSNNRRLAAHETQVNWNDLLNSQLGHPIRFRTPGMIQEIGVQSTVGSMLPLLQHLDTKSSNKVGVTDAAMGLDPDALQSTDKEAVQNTIMLSQGQIEVMARNLVETGMIPLFRILLRLSMLYMPAEQVLQYGGAAMMVNQHRFDPDLVMQANVGLGTASIPERKMMLQMVIQEQKSVVAQYGIDNPVVTPRQMYNAMADYMALSGIRNTSRYLNTITPEAEAQMLEQARQAAQNAQQPMDPNMAIIEAEKIKAAERQQSNKIKSLLDARSQARGNQLRALEMAARYDTDQDKIDHEREKTAAQLGDKFDERRLRAAQDAVRSMPMPGGQPANPMGGVNGR